MKIDLKCSIATALDFIGDTWSLLILRDFMIFGGTRRFEQLREALGISRNVLTERLRTLLQQEIIRKAPIDVGARRMEYKLSRKGWELMPILIGLNQWYERWQEEPAESAFQFVDKASNQEIVQMTVHAQDGRMLGPPDICVRAKTPAAQAYLESYKAGQKK